ncbi:MAG: hypothetical protein LPK58_07635 [Gammaproteobacteria bacterium]|nr:hypothetical protein [Gammaproteobacteria bacterium]
MHNPRPALAIIAGLLVALAVIAPLAWLVHTRDWGVALILLAPFVIYGLMRLARTLADWADTPPPSSGLRARGSDDPGPDGPA